MRSMLGKLTIVILLSALGISVSLAQSQSIKVDLKPIDTNPVLTPGAAGAWDAVSVRFPRVLYQDGMYYLFYGTFQNRTQPVSVGYATSEDGERWTKFSDNPILSGDGSGFDASGVTRPVVFVDGDGTWVMYYDGLAQVNQVFGTGIGRATAPAPQGPWARAESPVLQSGATNVWDSGFIFPDSVIHTEDSYVMYYSSALSVGRATSKDGLTWTKDADPVLTPAPAGQWDSAIAWGSDVHLTDHGWEMFYYGDRTRSGGPGINIGCAFSDDGISWERYSGNPVIDLVDQQAFFPSFVIDSEGTYRVYYAVASNGSYTEFHLATGTVTLAD